MNWNGSLLDSQEVKNYQFHGNPEKCPTYRIDGERPGNETDKNELHGDNAEDTQTHENRENDFVVSHFVRKLHSTFKRTRVNCSLSK